MLQMLIPRSHAQTTAARRWLADHPVLAFVVLAFGISYGLGVPWLVAVSAWARPGELVGRYLGRLFVVAGPALAAIAVAAATGGRPRVLELLDRFCPLRRRLAWYLLLPSLTLGISLGAYLAAGASPALLSGALARGWPRLLELYALETLVIGALEETGWRGWLLPRLLERYPPLAAAAITGAIWGVWHLPVLLNGASTAALFLGVVLALSILLTGLWHRVDGNLGLLALAHGSFNAPVVFLDPVVGPLLAPTAWRWTAALYGSVAALVLALTWRWWLQPPSADEPSPMQKSPSTQR